MLLALALVAGAAWLIQAQSAAQLRGELALLRDDNRELARLREEHARLAAAQPTAAQLAALRADHAAVVRLQGEINALKDQAPAVPAARDLSPGDRPRERGGAGVLHDTGEGLEECRPGDAGSGGRDGVVGGGRGQP